MRDSKISAQAWDTCTTWTKGSYDYEVIIECLRRLERPIPGHGGHTATNLGHFVEAESFAEFTDTAESFCGTCGSDGNYDYEHEEVYFNNSLFLLPESFDDLEDEDWELEEAFADPDCIYVASDVPTDGIINEDTAIAICANYGQVRKFLQKR